ncbi:hypothetical protein WISP_59771 [Willisornis vidua]|uniref:Uncharacterized protein n=1 Tax=Willisornis vidua TaxID=1566151 RepID=A0ABQ9DGP2_9PASS|nr:hypothetical protein WISP_59771 [Willisornis vidua]
MMKQLCPCNPWRSMAEEVSRLSEACGGSHTGVDGSDLRLQLEKCHAGGDTRQEWGLMERGPYRSRFSGPAAKGTSESLARPGQTECSDQE